MAEMLRAPTEGCAEAIVVPPIIAEQLELKHSLINMMTSEQFFGLKKDNPHDHVRWFNKITSTINSELAKLAHAVNQQTSAVTTAMTAMLKQFQSNPPPAQVKAVEKICVTYGGAHPYYQCLAAGGNTFPEYWDNIQGYVSAATGNYNQGNPGYRPQGVANQMRPPGFAQPNVQNNQNQFGQPQGFNRSLNFNQEQHYQATQSNQKFHLNEFEKIKRMNDVSLKAMQNQIDMVKNELRNEMKTSIQTSLSNQTNEIKKMMASLLQMNTASTSGSGALRGNTIANPKGELKAITTRSGLVTEGPTVPNPPKSVNPEEDECVEETYTDPDHAEYNIKVPPPPSVQKPKPSIQRNFVLHTRDSLPSHIPSELAKLAHAVNQQTSDVTTAMTTMLKQFQSNPPPAQVKAIKEICVTCGGAHPYYQCLAVDGNTFPEYQDNIQDMVKNELRNEMKTSIQTSLSNQTNEIKNMMASLLQMNTASTSGSRTLPVNTIANPKGELKAITTRSGLVTDGPTVLNPPKSGQLAGGLKKNPRQKFNESFHEAWERYKDLLRVYPHYGFTELHQLDTFYNALNPAVQDSLNAAAGGNLLEKSPQDALTIIENKSKVRNSRSKLIASPVNASMLKQLQLNLPPAQVKPIEEICVTCGGAHPYYQCLATGGNTFPEFWDNIQGYVSAAADNYNQGNPSYRPQGVANQMRPPSFAQPNVQNNQNRFGPPQGFNRGINFNQEQPYQATTQSNQNFHLNELEKIKRMNDVSLKAMQNQIDMVKNELRNEMKTSIQTSLSNQTNEIKNMITSLLQMKTASTSGSGSLPGNTVANPKGKLKAITTRSGLVTDGPTVPTPPKSINPEEDECVEETYTDPNLAKYIIKVPPPPVQKPKPPIQRHFLHTRDSPLLHIPSHAKIPKLLKALLSNKEKLQELANTPLNENCSTVILKKLPEKLGDPMKFLIPCGFSELKCKALADLGASINLMPLSVWKKLGLPDLIPTRMTLKLANRAICTPDGIARDVFVPVDKKTILKNSFALIDVYGEEMILRDGDERLTPNMKHNIASYSNHPHRDSANLINIFNISSEDCLEDLVLNKQSGNPTFSLHKEIASPEVIHEIHDSKGCTFLSEELPDIDSFNDIHPYFDDDPLSASTTYSSNSLLEEFTDELTLITYPPNYDDNHTCDIESDLREIEFLLYQGEDFDFKDSIDQSDLANLDDLFVDPTPEIYIDEQPPDNSFPPRFDVYPDDFLEIESDADNFDDDSFDSNGEKIKEFELLIDQLDLPCDILSEYDSFNSQVFSRNDDFPSPDNEDKVFNP
uniref:Reverse transcriptase domain-containing protein n=1 Tax=Tanacetum cinerariifolium TaxID=118510 RepID=A0A6L2JM14_TANCI|nr:hypothetical protein [Tanacetum cinerariifolium]